MFPAIQVEAQTLCFKTIQPDFVWFFEDFSPPIQEAYSVLN